MSNTKNFWNDKRQQIQRYNDNTPQTSGTHYPVKKASIDSMGLQTNNMKTTDTTYHPAANNKEQIHEHMKQMSAMIENNNTMYRNMMDMYNYNPMFPANITAYVDG